MAVKASNQKQGLKPNMFHLLREVPKNDRRTIILHVIENGHLCMASELPFQSAMGVIKSRLGVHNKELHHRLELGYLRIKIRE